MKYILMPIITIILILLVAILSPIFYLIFCIWHLKLLPFKQFFRKLFLDSEGEYIFSGYSTKEFIMTVLKIGDNF